MEEYRIIKALSGFYYVQTEDGVIECRARGRFRRQDQSPLVGDFVRITRQADKGVLEALLPRKNAFIRPAVANIDQLVVLASCAIPVTEPFLIDRVLAIARLQNVPALVVVNKDDLAPAQPLAEIYRRAGVPVLVTSAETGEGIEALREALAGKLSCLTGNSGVGKSSLLNRACPQLCLPVGEVSEKLGRGRHTTRVAELLPYEGGYIVDTPGFSAMEMAELQVTDLPHYFPEFRPYEGACRFSPCSHTHEPGCAVKAAVEEGSITRERYDAYEQILQEVKEAQMLARKKEYK